MNRDYAVQVSDRRLTQNARPVSDEVNKATILVCDDGRFIVGFAGLGTVGCGKSDENSAQSFRTQVWLHETLKACGPPDFSTRGIVERLTQRASVDFQSHPALAKIPVASKRLSLMFSGFLSTTKGPLLTGIFISNYQDFSTGIDAPQAWDSFECLPYFQSEDSENPTSVQRIGIWSEIAPEVERIRRLLKARKPPHAVIGKAVELIRAAADRRTTVGKQVMSVTLPADFALSPTSKYDVAFSSPTYYMADYVVVTRQSTCVFRDARLEAVGPNPKPIVVPEQKPIQACSCGSGKRYALCHGLHVRH